jgi:hypothetical protein
MLPKQSPQWTAAKSGKTAVDPPIETKPPIKITVTVAAILKNHMSETLKY